MNRVPADYSPLQSLNYSVLPHKPPNAHQIMFLFQLFSSVSGSTIILKHFVAYRCFSLLTVTDVRLFSSVFLAIILSLFISGALDSLQALKWWSLLCISVLILLLILIMIIIWRQPQSETEAAFMVCLWSCFLPPHI